LQRLETRSIKTIAITGATSGIGLATAEALLSKGNQLIFLARNLEKAKKLIQNLPNPENVKLIECDLAKLASVKKAGEELSKIVDKLDVLINNAGGTFKERTETKDGIEMHLAVNHISHFLLVKTCYQLLEKSNTKIINVSSEAHRAAKIDFSDFNMSKNYGAIKAYGNVKLYNILFTKSLVDRGFNAYALHPGVIDSNFGDELPGFLKVLWKLGKPFMKTTTEGAATSVYLAEVELNQDKNGGYFKNKKLFKESSTAKSKSVREKLWAKSEELIAEKMQAKK